MNKEIFLKEAVEYVAEKYQNYTGDLLLDDEKEVLKELINAWLNSLKSEEFYEDNEI